MVLILLLYSGASLARSHTMACSGGRNGPMGSHGDEGTITVVLEDDGGDGPGSISPHHRSVGASSGGSVLSSFMGEAHGWGHMGGR